MAAIPLAPVASALIRRGGRTPMRHLFPWLNRQRVLAAARVAGLVAFVALFVAAMALACVAPSP